LGHFFRFWEANWISQLQNRGMILRIEKINQDLPRKIKINLVFNNSQKKNGLNGQTALK